MVGLTCPKRLADGAANPQPKVTNNCNTFLWAGILKAMVSCPPVINLSTCGFFLKMIVNGPGQKCSANDQNGSGISSAQSFTCATEPIWTINGWSAGLPFMLKIRFTACGCEASAARP